MNKVRVSVSLWPNEKEVIEKIAHARGVSVSKVVGELVGASYDALSRLAAIMEMSQKAEAEFRSGLRGMVDEVADEVSTLYEQAVGSLDDVEKELKKITH